MKDNHVKVQSKLTKASQVRRDVDSLDRTANIENSTVSSLRLPAYTGAQNYTSLYIFTNVNVDVTASECKNITKDFEDWKICLQILITHIKSMGFLLKA